MLLSCGELELIWFAVVVKWVLLLILFCNNTTTFVYVFVLQMMEYQNKRGGRVKLLGLKVSPATSGVDELSTQDVLSFSRYIRIWAI